MAQNRFFTALEVLWDTVSPATGTAARTAAEKAALLRLKRVLQKELDVRSDIAWNHPDHAMYLYTRAGLETSHTRLLAAVRSKLTAEDTENATIQAALTAMEGEAVGSAGARVILVLRRFREWRNVVATESDSDSESN
jgi:hypothetical protein